MRALPADRAAVNAAAELIVKSLLAGIGSAAKGNRFDEVPPQDVASLPFEEAVAYLQKREILPAEKYYALSDRARFRAFTLSRIADGDIMERVKDELARNVEEGEGLSGFLKKTDTEILEGVGLSGAGGGWYWENVYRTNVQTAYNAGRALAFDAVKPVALELVGVGDARQTEVCRRLTQPPVRRLYTDGFWKTHWPPFHFGCRTTVRAIYDPAELEEEPLTDVPGGEEPAKGFGSNPLSSGNWWRELKSMAARAEKYGVQGEISRAKDVLVTRKSQGGGSSAIRDRKEYGEFSSLDFLFEDIREGDREQVAGDLAKTNPEHLPLLLRYGKDMRGDFYWDKGVPYYSPETNRIYLNILEENPRSEVLDYEANTTTLLHEWGHWLDHNMLRNGKTLREQMPDLGRFLEEDAILFTKRLIKPEEVVKSAGDLVALPPDMRGKIQKNLAENGDLKNGVSDIFSGLTKGSIMGGWGHEWSYWTNGVLEKEAIAHFFEAQAAGGEKLEILKEYFPTAYAYFETTLKGFWHYGKT